MRDIDGNVGILDLPGFARFEVAGAGAAAWLDGLIAGALPRVGRISLAYMCSPRGALVSESTITRFEDDRFWLPLLFAGETFRGRFVFEGDRMLDFALAEGRAPFRRLSVANDAGSTGLVRKAPSNSTRQPAIRSASGPLHQT